MATDGSHAQLFTLQQQAHDFGSLLTVERLDFTYNRLDSMTLRVVVQTVACDRYHQAAVTDLDFELSVQQPADLDTSRLAAASATKDSGWSLAQAFNAH